MNLSSVGAPLRGAVVGYGFISSKGHVPAFLERFQRFRDFEIVAIVDICEERRREAADKYPGIRVYPSYHELLEKESSQLDFVDICTPPSDHARIAHSALERGLHVICEKPLAPTEAEIEELICQAQKAERVLFPCHNYKYAPIVREIQRELKSGSIGTVRSLTLSTFRNTHAKGVSEWRPHWRRERRISGGGIAMDHGSHSFYLMFEWMRTLPRSVSARVMNLGSTEFDTEDNFSAVFTFPEGIAQVYLSWTAGVRKVIYTLQGTKGALRIEDDDLELALMKQIQGEDVAQGAVSWEFLRKTVQSDWMDASHTHWYFSMLDRFKECIRQKKFISQDTLQAYQCVQLINAAYRSAAAGGLEIPFNHQVAKFNHLE